MGLYLSSASGRHLAASIYHHGIIIPVALPCGPGNGRYLNGLPLGGYYCWGCTVQRTRTFNMLNVGDEVLLFENGTGNIAYHGLITHKLPHADNTLANAIWGSDHDNIFLVDSIRNLLIQKRDFMRDLTGKDNDTLQSPRYIGKNNWPNLWDQYLAIKRQYGI
jgi:hypothetical protein